MVEIVYQTLKTEHDELVVLSRSEFDRLLRIVDRSEEDAEDVAIFDARMADLAGGNDVRLPAPVSSLILQGNSLLKSLRLWRDETQAHLSILADLSQGYISDLENGRRTATPDAMKKIAAALKIDATWLSLYAQGKSSDVGPPHMTALSATVAFDYKANNGLYVIGDGRLRFETKWSAAGSNNVHLYNDPATIKGVAIAVAARYINDVTDASSYDFTSRSQAPSEGEVVILQNSNGFYAALKIIKVQNADRGARTDELRFEYVINANGSGSFANPD